MARNCRNLRKLEYHGRDCRGHAVESQLHVQDCASINLGHVTLQCSQAACELLRLS